MSDVRQISPDGRDEEFYERLLDELTSSRDFSRAAFIRRAAALGLAFPTIKEIVDFADSHSSKGPIKEKLLRPVPPGADLSKLGPFRYCSQSLTVKDALNWKIPKAKKQYKIGYMLISLQGYYFIGTAYGAQFAARRAGVKIQRVAAQGFASPDIQLNQVGNLLQRGVDAIVLQPADVNGSVPVVEKALKAGVPVVVAGTLLNTNKVAEAVQSDYALGQQAADIVARKLGGRNGEGIIIAGPASATWSSNRTKGFKDRVKAKYPNIKVVATPNQNFVSPTEGLTSFLNATQAHPDIGWTYAVDYNLLEAPSIPSKYRGKMAYVGMGLYGTSVKALKQGQVQAIIGIMPVFGAILGVSRAVQLLNGQAVPAITCYPAPVYTKDRVNAPEVKFDLYPSWFKV